MSKLLTVFGATGNQGGSVIGAVLAHPSLSKEYKLRGITRDTTKPAAQALQSKGVETVKADLNDKESIIEAIKGSHAVFAVTNYWESASKAVEYSQGVNITDACVASGVKCLVWSSLPNVTALSNGALRHVEHFDSKSEVEAYIRKQPDLTGTFFMPAFFMQNIKGMIHPDPESGVPTFTMPWEAAKTNVPVIDIVNDAGKYVAAILAANPATVDGKNFQGTSQWVTPQEIVDTISKVSGTEVKFKSVPEDVYATFLPPAVAEELKENMVLIRDYKYYGNDGPDKQPESDTILEDAGLKPVSWKEFVEQNGPWKW